MIVRAGALALFFIAAAPPAVAQESVPRGAPLRTELLDTMRPAFEQETGGPVEFVVNRLARWRGWAFASVRPQRPGGRPIDWRRTEYREAFEAGAFEPGLALALLQQQGGRWVLRERAIGPTDVAWLDWQERYRLPRALFEE